MSNVVKLATIATSHGLGPYYPALRTDRLVYYWPNITKPTEDEAIAWAQAALDAVEHAIETITRTWNVYETT